MVQIRNGCFHTASQNPCLCGKLLSWVQMEFTTVFISRHLCMLQGRARMNTHKLYRHAAGSLEDSSLRPVSPALRNWSNLQGDTVSKKTCLLGSRPSWPKGPNLLKFSLCTSRRYMESEVRAAVMFNLGTAGGVLVSFCRFIPEDSVFGTHRIWR